MSTPQDQPPDVAASVARIRRGCLFIVFLLVLVVLFNVLQYGLNVAAIGGGVLLLIALAGFVLISREGRGPSGG
jgi:hypothetical protein